MVTETVPPAGVNFTALPRRFTTACTTRSPSTTTCSWAGPWTSRTPPSAAATDTASTASAIRGASGWARGCSGNDPCWSRSRSMMSSTSRLRRRVPRSARPTTSVAAGGSAPASPSASSSRDPWTDVRGVRSSWLTEATNPCFIASSRWYSAVSSRSSSVRRATRSSSRRRSRCRSAVIATWRSPARARVIPASSEPDHPDPRPRMTNRASATAAVRSGSTGVTIPVVCRWTVRTAPCRATATIAPAPSRTGARMNARSTTVPIVSTPRTLSRAYPLSANV